MNPRMMLILVPVVSLESPLNIDTKISTNMPSIWLLWCHNDMHPHKSFKKIGFLYKSIGKNYFFAKIWKQYLLIWWCKTTFMHSTCLLYKVMVARSGNHTPYLSTLKTYPTTGRSYTPRFCIKMTAEDARAVIKIISRENRAF